jgi:3-oxoacyl-[acyl-carrier-protein] synthase II
MQAISRRNEAPQQASRPFDIDRDGFVPAEGAGVLVLEDLEHALARGAHIYCEILGYGHTTDAFHITAPLESAESAARAIKIALQDADVSAQDLDYINAHGTSTQLNDSAETRALKLALGETAYQIPISSTKSVTGHMMGGAASVEAVLTMMAMQHSFIPPTINLDNQDPDCDLNYTPKQGVEAEIRIAMSNAFGFGGHNAVIVFSRYPA